MPGNDTGPKNTDQKEEAKNEQDPDHRTIERIGWFEIKEEDSEPFRKKIGDNITIKNKLGEGGFCKVKHVTVKVLRPIPNKQTGEEEEVDGEQ